MKYLRIDNGKAYYLGSDDDSYEVDSIQKEDMLHLLDAATNKEVDFEMDACVDEIHNEAHRIIYKELYKRLQELLDNKDKFLDESEILYKEALQKYKDVESAVHAE